MEKNKIRRHNNSVFCCACRKHKMLFETKQQADNFLKFNSDTILEENGKAPIRSYKCSFCGGYHVTSIQSEMVGEMREARDQRLMRSLDNDKRHEEEVKPIIERIQNELQEIDVMFHYADVRDIEDKLDVCNFDLVELRESIEKYRLDSRKYLKLLGRFNKTNRTVEALNATEDMDDAEAEVYVEQHFTDIRTIMFKKNRLMRSVGIEVEELMEVMEEVDENCELQKLQSLRSQCLELMNSLTNKAAKKLKAKFFPIVEKLYNEKKQAICERMSEENEPTEQLECVQEHEEEVFVMDQPVFDSKEYKNTILNLIGKVKVINECFEAGEYDRCLEEIDVAESVLDFLDVENDDTRLIKGILDRVKDGIENM